MSSDIWHIILLLLSPCGEEKEKEKQKEIKVECEKALHYIQDGGGYWVGVDLILSLDLRCTCIALILILQVTVYFSRKEIDSYTMTDEEGK